MLMLLAIQAATIATPRGTVPTPPPIVPVYAVPTISEPLDRTAPPRLSEVEVVIRAPAGILWQGMLRVADRGESNWSQTRSEPPRQPCAVRSSYWNGDREMLSLSLSPGARDTPDGMIVQVRWARRGDDTCDGLRTVELRQTVALPSRQTAVVTGDGGLRVELRRR